jgi:hypothetical protein
MKFKSALVTQVSGSIGGMTGAHNAGGLYFRARAIPTDPGTEFQVAVRNIMVQLSPRWSDTLDQDQRDGWDVYAQNVPLIDTLGDPRNVSGLAQYIRSNTARFQAGLAFVDDAPTVFNLPAFNAPTIAAFVAAANTYDIAYDNSDEWAIADGGGMLIYGSRPQNEGINFFKGPYRFAGIILGAVVPPTSPETITNPFAFVDGNKLFLRVVVVTPDGRVSNSFRLSGISA